MSASSLLAVARHVVVAAAVAGIGFMIAPSLVRGLDPERYDTLTLGITPAPLRLGGVRAHGGRTGGELAGPPPHLNAGR